MFQINRGTLPPNSQRNGANMALFTNLPKIHEGLIGASRKFGHSIDLIIPKELQKLSPEGLAETLYRIRDRADVIIPYNKKPFSFSLLKILESWGVPSLNPSEAISRTSCKLKTLKLLDDNNLPIPKTSFLTKETEKTGANLQGVQNVMDAVDYVGGFPCVVKTFHGSKGNGVYLVSSKKEFEKLTKELEFKQEPYLIQEFIAGAGGKDFRYFVVDGEVVTAMQRQAKEGDFRSNIAQGGTGNKHGIKPEEAYLAIRASRLSGLVLSGVDLIPTEGGVLEPIFMKDIFF